MEGGLQPQAAQAFSNLRRALEAGGSSMQHVVKVTMYVTGTSFADVRQLRRQWFSDPYPAVSIVQIQALYDPAAVIEMDAVGLVARKAM